MKYVALIPARGGSTSIEKKNIKPIAGQPLIFWACRAAQLCPAIEVVYVATDDSEIAEVVEGFQMDKVRVVERAPDTATATASTESVMLDFAGRVEFDHLFLLQATSPLIRRDDLCKAMALYESGRFDSVLSVVRQTRFIWKKEGDGAVTAQNYDPFRRPLRQDFDGFMVENGALYVTSRARLLETECRISGRIGAIEMAEESYFELDEPHDWIIVDGLLRHMNASAGNMVERLRCIRLVASDVDGVLTDTGMYYGEGGDELKRFSTRDGMGFRLLQEAGIKTALITAEDMQLNRRRAEKLQIDDHLHGIKDKVAAMASLLKKYGLSWNEVAYIGDDVNDAELLKKVGISVCPSDAVSVIQEIVTMPMRAPGGAGAFRELADLVLAAR